MGDGCDFARWEEDEKADTVSNSELIKALGRVEVVRDDVAEKLDEMADVCEYWKRNRDKGRHPNAIRAALIMLAEEVVALTGLKVRPNDHEITGWRYRRDINTEPIHGTSLQNRQHQPVPVD